MKTLDARLRRLNLVRLIAFLGILFAGLAGLFFIDNLLLSFVIAVIVSYLASPYVAYLEGTGLSRLTAISIVFCFFSSLTVIAIVWVTPFLINQLANLKTDLPRYVDGTAALFGQVTAQLTEFSGGFVEFDINEQIRDWLLRQSSLLVEGLPRALSSSLSVLFLSPLLGFFILKDGRNVSRDLLSLVPNNLFELALNLQHQINDQIGQFIRARLLESLIVGAVVLVGLWIIDFPFAVLLACFAAITNLIPYIGPIVGAVPAVIIALINQVSGLSLALLALVYVIAQLIDMLFIIPLVVARIVNLHPVTVILAVIIGAEFMGVLGMLISIPVASALKVTLTTVYRHMTDFAGTR